MTLTKPEKILLRKMKASQCSLAFYVVVDCENKKIIQSGGYYTDEIDSALKAQSHVVNIHLQPIVIEHALKRLTGYCYISHPSSGPVYQVTYDGWYNSYIQRVEAFFSLLNNLFFPFLVSLGTTLLTLAVNHVLTP